MTAVDGYPNYLLRHWRGELPLARSFWIDTFAVNCAIRLFSLIVSAYSDELPIWAAPFIVASFWLFSPLVITWQIVGVSRSATRYAKSVNAILYPVLAWVALIVLGVSCIYSFVLNGVPQLADSLRFVRGDPQWPDPILTVLPTGTEIEFSGIIKANSAARLEHFITVHSSITILHLDTSGGREREAEAMASVIRHHGLITYVAAHCNSCGVIVFLAGKQRFIRADSRLGFHAWKGVGILDNNTNEQQVKILMGAGANTVFVERVINTSSDEIWYPPIKDLINQGLATRITDGTGFSLGSKELAKYTAKGLQDELNDNPEMNALSLREPESYGIAIENAARTIAGGADMGTSLAEVQALLAMAIHNAYPCASNAALDACLDLNLEILARNMYRSPKETLQVISLKAARTAVPDFPFEAETKYITALLESPVTPAVSINSAMAISDGKRLMLLSNANGDPKAPFTGIPDDRVSQIAVCEAMNNFLTEVKGLPPDRRYPLIRLIFGLSPQQLGISPPNGIQYPTPFQMPPSPTTAKHHDGANPTPFRLD